MTRFSTAHPADATLPDDVVVYGPDLPSERELKLLGRVEAKRVLDLGCGGGKNAIALARQGAKVIAVDESSDQVAAARRAAEAAEVRLELHHAPLAELAFVRADTIDMALSVYALAAVDDLDRLFRQVHRVLKPEHPLVFSVPHPITAMLDDVDPGRLRRRYDDGTPRPWATADGVSGVDHPRTVSDLFVSLGRANFRVDTIQEPLRGAVGAGAPAADQLVPPSLVIRARKQGI